MCVSAPPATCLILITTTSVTLVADRLSSSITVRCPPGTAPSMTAVQPRALLVGMTCTTNSYVVVQVTGLSITKGSRLRAFHLWC